MKTDIFRHTGQLYAKTATIILILLFCTYSAKGSLPEGVSRDIDPTRSIDSVCNCRAALLDSLLLRVYIEDQSIRQGFERIVQSNNADSILAFSIKMEETDHRCQEIVFPILDSLGIPDGLSDSSYTALFLVVQHAEIDAQHKYISLFQSAAKRGLVSPSNVATMQDRILMREGLPQIYGTQTSTINRIILIDNNDNASIDTSGKGTQSESNSVIYLWPVSSPDSLDIRRAEVGLIPIQEYIAIFRELGMELIWDRSLTIEHFQNPNR